MQNITPRSRAQGCTSGRSDRKVKRKRTGCTSARSDVSPPDKKPLSGSDPRKGALVWKRPQTTACVCKPISDFRAQRSRCQCLCATHVRDGIPTIAIAPDRLLLVARSDRRPPPNLSSYALRMAATCTIHCFLPLVYEEKRKLHFYFVHYRSVRVKQLAHKRKERRTHRPKKHYTRALGGRDGALYPQQRHGCRRK